MAMPKLVGATNWVPRVIHSCKLLVFPTASDRVAMMLHCSRFESESLQVGALNQLDNPCHTVSHRAMDQCHDIKRLPVN